MKKQVKKVPVSTMAYQVCGGLMRAVSFMAFSEFLKSIFLKVIVLQNHTLGLIPATHVLTVVTFLKNYLPLNNSSVG